MNNQFFEYAIDELHNCDEFIDYVRSLSEDKTNEFAQVICHDGIYSMDDKYTYTSAWYLENLQVIADYVDGNPLDKTQQFITYYLIQLRFMANVEERNKNVLTAEEYESFIQLVKRILQNLSVEIILNVKYEYIEYGNVLKRYFLELVGQTSYFLVLHEMEHVAINVQCMNFHKGILSIDLALQNDVFLQKREILIEALMGDERYIVKKTKRYSAMKFFNVEYYNQYVGSVDIPIKDSNLKSSIVFEMTEEQTKKVLPIEFSSIHSKLCEKFEKSYWNIGNHTISYESKHQAIVIESRTPFRTFAKEINFWLNCLNKGSSFTRSIKSILLRFCYYITLLYYKNHSVWLTFDQLYKGGDNGQYFYQYVSGIRSKEEVIYYVVRPDTNAYHKLKNKYKTVIAYNSFYHKLLSLHAKAVFATRTEVHLCCGYWNELEIYIRGLFQPDIFCLQHGVTIQEIAKYQNRVYDNTKLYFCVSKKEVDNLKQPSYDYKKENLLLTGAPRYDGLVDNRERMILISPTWRRSIVIGENKKGELHKYNPWFKGSSYYKVYQGLLQNENLVAWAKEKGYRIVFLLHPIVSVQIDDFNYEGPIEVVSGSAETSYEEYLNKASILITDYSGIQFDFAYMKKPIIYFQPDNLPAQYGVGGLDYEKEGFGPICKNEEELVNTIFIYENHSDEWNKEYLNRIRNFFAYDDRNNCARIYQAVKAYQLDWNERN